MEAPSLICPPEARWSCQLAKDWSIDLPDLVGRVSKPYTFRVERPEQFCREWLHLDSEGRLTIFAGYATDGCSMVPDFPKALPGCILHDALRQAATLDKARCPWTRAEADHIFRRTLIAFGFNFWGSWLFYLGVAGPTGWIYSWLKNLLKPAIDRAC